MTRQGLLKQIQRRNEPLKRIKELEEQNANLIAMLKAEREVRVNDDYLKGICERDAEIDDLKERFDRIIELLEDLTKPHCEIKPLERRR